MSSNSYGPTSGNDERSSRSLMEPVLAFTLRDEINELRRESEWRDGDRNSMTLAKDLDFRVLLSVLRDGATLHEDDGDARTSVQLIEGTAVLEIDGNAVELNAGQLAVVDVGNRWRLHSKTEAAVLLTFAWPREKAGV